MEYLNRKQFLRRAVAGSGVLALTGGTVAAGCSAESSQAGKARKDATGKSGKEANEDPYAPQVEEGLAHFRRRADDQLPLVEALVDAVRSGDLQAARKAYIEARPPYEEIEVLAASFEQTDSDLDARPYDFDAGERSRQFRGFHRIEALIFRDEDLKAALPYTEGLVQNVETLQEDLKRRESFTSAMSFEGMIALATEVASKKISSEEETYSDQSLLIFKYNWEGISSQFEPFSAELEKRNQEAAAGVRDAYQAARSLLEPRFSRGEVAAEPYSQVSIAERGEIVRASYHLSDTLSRASKVLGLTA